MQEYFYGLCESAFSKINASEVMLCNFNGESSDFVRLNGGRVRQAGGVRQGYLGMTLVSGKRHASQSLTVTGQPQIDKKTMLQALEGLRSLLQVLPEDPYLLYNTEVASSEKQMTNRLVPAADCIDRICELSKDLDLVGIYCSGSLQRGFANSLGQRNWFETSSFNFDWSCYLEKDKAVKSTYAGFEWDDAFFTNKLDSCRLQLDSLRLPPVNIKPGEYRVFLSPTAVDEVCQILNWGGFSEKALRTKTSCFSQMRDQQAKLSPLVGFSENLGKGAAANFDALGFKRPEQVDVFVEGQLRQGLVSARTAKEYELEGTGAAPDEGFEALEVKQGNLAAGSVMDALDTGVYVNNLWYLNYSDRVKGRLTGMTRFATLWVEGGKVKGPLDVMRFDDSVYDFFGSNLIDLTKERELLMSTMTYHQRSTSCSLLPGALIDRFKFTL